MLIKNREKIIDQLTEMLMQFDKDGNKYQTDVYLYYDEENQTAELHTFVNVGGNSWLDDDHYTIYTDKEHYDDGVFSYYQDSCEIAEALEITNTELEYDIRQFHKLDADEEPDWYDTCKFIESNDEYMAILIQNYYDYIEEMRPEYVHRAEIIMEDFERDYEMSE